MVPLKHLATINDEKLPETTEPDREIRYLDIGAVGRGHLVERPISISFEEAPSRARRVVRPGDTIVSTVRTYLRATWTVDDDAEDLIASTGFAVVRPRDVDARYLAWALQADSFVEEVVARSAGVSYPAVNPDVLATLPIRVPEKATQRRIADFLDAETARIDALVDAKQQMIGMLGIRYLATLVETTLTTESPSRPLRHWFDSTFGGTWGGDPGSLVADVACVRGTDFDFIELRVKPGPPRRSVTAADLKARTLLPGDLVIEKSGGGEQQSVGRVVRWTSWIAAVPTNFAAGLRPAEDVDAEYTTYLLRALYAQGVTVRWIKQTTGIQNLDLGGLLTERVPCPQLSQQRSMAASLRSALRRWIDSTTTLTEQIDLLKERRSALITAAVSGELEL